jgi:hypothetical protein
LSGSNQVAIIAGYAILPYMNYLYFGGFMYLKKLLWISIICNILSVFPVHTQEKSAHDRQIDRLQLLKTLTFDDAACILGYTRFCELYARKEQELRILLDCVYAEQDAIFAKNRLDIKPVADYYSQREITDPCFFDESMRSHGVKDFFNIALYRLIYTMAFENAMYLNQDSGAMLLFKNVLTPRAFDEAHSWILVNHSPIAISDFPSSVQEKAIAFAKQLTFDESIAWLLRASLFIRDKNDVIYTIDDLLSSVEDVVLLNQTIRTIFEQQKLPEHRTLARLLYTDQEVANGYNNGKLLSEGLTISSKEFSKQDANAL